LKKGPSTLAKNASAMQLVGGDGRLFRREGNVFGKPQQPRAVSQGTRMAVNREKKAKMRAEKCKIKGNERAPRAPTRDVFHFSIRNFTFSMLSACLMISRGVFAEFVMLVESVNAQP
jgi:hypothetical protein